MNTEQRRFAQLLAQLAQDDLVALRQAADRSPQVVPGLLAWPEHAFGWEIDRRVGLDYRLALPMEAIPPKEASQSVTAATAIAASFVGDKAGNEDNPIVCLFRQVVASVGVAGPLRRSTRRIPFGHKGCRSGH